MTDDTSTPARRGRQAPVHPEGAQFGRWTVIGSFIKRGKARYYPCRCECGNERYVNSANLNTGVSTGCGCRRHRKNDPTAVTNQPGFECWRNMIRRATDPIRYPSYAGRGITVDPRWKESFWNFLDDMGPRPSPNHSIDRIDDAPIYSKATCRWSTRAEQQFNRARTTKVNLDGETISLHEAARRRGIPYPTIHHRIKNMGWSVERALAEPPNPAFRRHRKKVHD